MSARPKVESIEEGSPAAIGVTHVELFLRATGYGLGISSFEAVSEGLSFFYSELYLALFEGDQGMRVLGAKLEAIHRDVQSEGRARPSANIGALPYRPRIETDTTSGAITEEDRRAEIELDLIKKLLDKRQGETALRLLAGLQDRIDRGQVSNPIRFRFFVNKGVSHMLGGDWDRAEQEFERARTLEPGNRKALLNLAYVTNFKGQYEVALAHIASVLAQDSTDVTANALRLTLLHELGRDQEIREILNAQPSLVDDGHCLYTLAYIAVDVNKFDEAEAYLRRYNEIDDRYPEAWELLGRTIIIPAQQELRATAVSTEWLPADKRQRIEEAESCFSKAVQLLASAESPRDLACTLGNRGMARSLLGRYDEARQDYERALHTDASQEAIKGNLGRLYIVTERPQDAVHILERIQSPALRSEIAPILAAAYLDLKKPAAAREVLEALVDDTEREDGLLVKDILLLSYQQLKDQDACRRILSVLDAYTNVPEARRITAEFRARERDFDEAIRLMHLAIEQGGTQGAARYRLLLGDLLYRANRFAEAADEYEQVPVPVGESRACMRHLMALFIAGRLPKALRLAQTVRNGRPAIADFSEVESLIHERSGDLESADRLRRELLSSGISPTRQKLKIALNLVRQGIHTEASVLVVPIDLATIADDPELLHDVAVLRTVLGLPGALLFAHKLLQVEPNDPDVHLFYINTFFRREESDKALLNPEVVSSDTFITLCHSGQIQHLTIVEGHGDTSRDWLSNEHEFAKELLGKRVGERFQFPREGPAAADYEVQAIQSKYVRAFQDCLGRFNERFPSHYGLTRIDITPDDPTKVVLMLERRRAHSERILDFYRSGQIPACTAAQLLGKSDVEFFHALVQDRQMKILSFDGNRDQMNLEIALVSGTESLLLESSALVTLYSLDLLPKLSASFKTLWITQQAVDALTETIRNLFPEKQSGTLFSDSPGHIQVVSRTSDEVLAEQAFYQGLLECIRATCRVLTSVTVDEFEQANNRRMLGSVAFSTMSGAKGPGILLVSDDLPLRVFAKKGSSILSVGSLSLLKYLRTQASLSPQEYHKTIQWFVERGFSFISVDKDDIIWVFQKNDWSPTSEVAVFLQTLAGPDCDPRDAMRIGLNVLYELWSEPLSSATKQLVSDLVLTALMMGRNPRQVLQSLLVMNGRRSLIWTPATDQIQNVIRNWMASRRRSG